MLFGHEAVLSSSIASSRKCLQITSTASSMGTFVKREDTSKLTNNSSGLGFTLDMISKKCLEICLRSTYFCFKDTFYEQREGTVMGSPVSGVVANLYMEHFEHLALESAPAWLEIWKRYVDDSCCIIES